MAFYVKMSSAPGECAREAMRQGLGVSAAVAIGYTVVNHDHRRFRQNVWVSAHTYAYMPIHMHICTPCMLCLRA